LKIEDGVGGRARFFAALALFRGLGFIPPLGAEKENAVFQPTITNHRGLQVGQIETLIAPTLP
jgi:hypothetical protein